MAVGLALLGIALGLRAVEGKTFLYADLQHFFQFAEVAFTRDHAEYYASVADQRYTYAHLPLFPLMLAPVVRVYRALGWEPILAVKTLVHVFDVGTAILLIRLARRNGLPRAAALGVGALWLYAPWVYEAGALNGHVASVAAFFLVAGLLRAGVAWQAGILLALAFTTRSELLVAALAMGGVYARRGRGALGAYALGAGGVFAVVVGPYLVRDAAALHWGVVGHLAGRGDGLPVLRSFIQTATGAFPDALAGPQDWAMPVALGIAILVGLVERDPSGAVFRASLVYALALTLGHGRYFVFPLVAGLAFGARPWVIVGLAGWYALEFLVPMAIDVRWIVRALAIAAVLAWPLMRRGPRRARAPAAGSPGPRSR